MSLSPLLRRGFLLLRDGKVDELLAELGHLDDGGHALRPFLPHLVRLVVLSRPESATSQGPLGRRNSILSVISGVEAAQPILSSVSVDLEKLKRDIVSEKQLRLKQTASGGLSRESALLQSLEHSLEVEFDQADSDRKLRLFLCELLRLSAEVQARQGEWFPMSHPLFDSLMYANDLVDFLHLALTDLHPLVTCEEVTDVLIRLEHGGSLLLQLVAGLPHFHQNVLDAVVACTRRHGNEQSQAWQACSGVMLSLCRLDAPLAALRTRELCIKSGAPAPCMLILTDEIARSAQDEGTLFGGARGTVWLDFITSLLLGEKCTARDSILQYIQVAQKKSSRSVRAHPAFESLLESIHQELLSLFMASHPQAQLLGVIGGGTTAESSGSVDEMIMDEGTSGQGGVDGIGDGAGSLVHEEVMDVGMSDLASGSHGDSLNDGFTEVEELQSGTAMAASMPGTSLQLDESTEDLLKHFDAGVLGLDTSMVSLGDASVNLDFSVKGLLQLPESETSRGCQLLLSFCALVGMANLRLSGEQTEPLVQIITARPPLTESGARFVELALCTLLICPSLTGDIEHSRCVVDWLRWLLQEQPAFDKALGSHVPYGELLLLVAIHYHGGQQERIVELVRMVLGIDIQLSSSRLIGVKMLFTQDVFTEKVVIEHAVNVGVTPQLSANMTNYLPIHCLLELLQTRSFARHATQLKEWIYRQLLESAAPVHSLLPQLIDEFVRTLVVPAQGVGLPAEGVHRGFSDAEILAVFHDSVEMVGRNSQTSGQVTRDVVTTSVTDTGERHFAAAPSAGAADDDDDNNMEASVSLACRHADGACSPVVQLLMLYYVLTYHDSLLVNLKKILTLPTVSAMANPVALSPFSLVSRLPVKRLLVHARTSPRQFGNLYARLLRLLLTHLPHLCLTQDWLAEEGELSAGLAGSALPALAGRPASDSPALAKRSRNAGRNFRSWVSSLERQVKLPTAQELDLAYDQVASSPALCTSCLKRLCCLKDPALLLPYLDTITSALPKLLDPRTPRIVLTSTSTLWRRLSSVVPCQLWVATVNALRETASHPPGRLTPSEVGAAYSDYTEADLISNPMLILACRREVFRCPVVLDLVCRVLIAYLAARTADVTEKSRNIVLLGYCKQRKKHEAVLGSEPPNLAVLEHENEELRSAMFSAEDSLAVQMLLEICLPTQEEIESGKADEDLCELSEIRGVVASVLHQMFIDDQSIVKLVHFQGYDERLLPILIASVPSMYVCVDFIAELLTQPQQDKQVFALQLCFHLCSHYPLRRTLSVARSAMSHLSMIMSARAMSEYTAVFLPVLPAMTRACRVLPTLLEDAIPLLLRLGHILNSVGKEGLSAFASPPLSPVNVWKSSTLAQAAALPATTQHQQLLQALHTIFDAAR